MTTTYNVLAVSTVSSPITHTSGSSGNESLVMRAPIVTPRGIAYAPTLSGNAIRHRVIREPGARWLIDQYSLVGKMTLQQLNFAFHGGNLTDGGGREDTRLIADMQAIFPLFRLLGGSLPNQILSGSMLVWPGVLVCEENRQALASMLPTNWSFPDVPLRPAESFVERVQYTRGDASKSHVSLISEDLVETKSNLMIFSGQAVIRGACFIHGFTLQHVSRLELGALLLSLSLWQQAGGTIGGAGARGHGKLTTRLHIDADIVGCVDEYVQHVVASKDKAIAWMDLAFARKPKKSKKEAVAAGGAD
jgi:hypothetical protein